jgi:hypothetical protein
MITFFPLTALVAGICAGTRLTNQAAMTPHPHNAAPSMKPDMVTAEGGLALEGFPHPVFLRLDVSDFSMSPALGTMVLVEGGMLSISNSMVDSTAVETFYIGQY